MDSNGRSASHWVALPLDLAWGFVLVTLLCLATGWLAGPPVLFYLLTVALYLCVCGLVSRAWPENRDFGWANRATLLRGCLVIVLFALAPFAEHLTDNLWLYGWMALLALILDGVDGKVARATGSESDFGARFDMELDALFILGLSIAIVTLLVAVLPPINSLFASTTLATALALLVWSFFVDIHWLYQRRHHHDVQ